MKSQAQTDSEILSSAKDGDVITTEHQSVINVRHTRSVHPVQCFCSLCRDEDIRFKPYSTPNIQEKMDELDWYRE